MDIIRYELKKMFLHQKGIIFVALFLVFKVVLLVFSDVPSNPELERYKKEYSYYLEQVKGAFSDKSEKFIENESEFINKAVSTVQTTYSKYYDGFISESELNKTVNPLLEKLKYQPGFEAVYQQYLYIRENPSKRYFVYTNGWDALLSDNKPDFLLILVIFLLLAPVYCEEGKCQMDILGTTMKKGGTYLSKYKIAVSMFVVLLLSIYSNSMEYVFCSVKYGLPKGEYPLQSLQYFGESTKTISLSQATFSIMGLKTVGCLCLGIIVIFGTVLFRKYAATLLLCMAMILLPIVCLSDNIQYNLPGPAAFLTPSGFFVGNQVSVSDITNESVITFQEIPKGRLWILLAVTIMLSITLLYVVQRKCSNKWKKTRRILHRLSVVCLVAVILLPLFTGCASEKHLYHEVYNSTASCYFENDRYLVYVDYDKDLNGVLTVEDKENHNRCSPLVRDVFQSTCEISDFIYGNGDYVYYMKMTADKSETFLYKMYDHLMIQEVDLTDFSERTVLRVDLNVKNLLGDYFSKAGENWDFFSSITSFFVDEDYIYFVSPDKGIYRRKRNGGNNEIIVENSQITDVTSVAYNGQDIFYLNEKSELIQYCIREKKNYIISDIIATKFYLYNNIIYFLNRKEKGAIYKYNMLTKKSTKLSDKTAIWLAGDEKYLFFEDYDNMFRIDLDGSNEVKMPNLFQDRSNYLFSKSQKLYSISSDGTNKFAVDEVSMEKMNITNRKEDEYEKE